MGKDLFASNNVVPFAPKVEETKAAVPPKVEIAADDNLDYIAKRNLTYATIIIKGTLKVLHEKPDGTVEFMEPASYAKNLSNERVMITPESGNPKYHQITDLWFESNKRRRYDNGLEFDLSHIGHKDGKYNLWNGYKLGVGKSGDIAPFHGLMKDVICSGDEKHSLFLEVIVADMFQRPGKKPGIAVVIRGDEGIGKSFFVEKLYELMAPYSFKTSNPAYVFGDHNGQLKDKLLLHLEEAVWAESRKDESLLKDLITGPTIPINDKYVPVYEVPNHLHLFITGNPIWLVSAGFKARRLFALKASEAHIIDTTYFAGLDEWFKNGGDAALLHYFFNFDIKAALTELGLDDIRKVPVTAELVHQKKQSMDNVSEWLDNLIESHIMPYGTLVGESEEQTEDGGTLLKNVHVHVIKKALYYDYCKSQERLRSRVILTNKKFGARLLELLPLVINGKVVKHANGKAKSIVNPDIKATDNFKTQRDAYDFPPWSVVQQAFEFNFGVDHRENSADNGQNSAKEWNISELFYPDMRNY